ncbi:MAG TPA: GWxTD domain-containing protein [Terriglobia bacterium]|nr:GWxTD domain-containing protein [Terriglobia bacterium]
MRNPNDRGGVLMSPVRSRRLPGLGRSGAFLASVALGLLALVRVSLPAVPSDDPTNPKPAADQPQHKLTREEKRRQKEIQKEMEGPYKKWLDEEVPYIITPEERAAFKKLTTDEEKENFVEGFWDRRNPDPSSPENEYKEEYYRRIAYSNEHYASGIPGWRTDRGRIYIMYGPPDEVDSHPSGGTYERPPEEGGGETSTFPFEDWRYRYIDGIGTNIILEFVDPSMSGEYHLTMDPGEKDALLHVPNAGLTTLESMGMASKADRFTRTDGMTIGQPLGGTPESMEEFTRLDLYSKIWKPPDVKFKDLKAVVTSKLSAQLLPFDVRTHFIRITDDSVLTPITIQVSNRDLEFQNKDGVMHASMDIFAQLSTLTGRIANTVEDSVVVDVPQHDLESYLNRKWVYQKAVPLRPGRYKLSVVLKDGNNGHMGSMEQSIIVPRYEDDKLSNSSLILADLIQQIPTNQVGTGPFVIGGTKVRPSVNQTFTRDQNLGIYMQIYNLGLDPKTHKPSGEVEYDIMKDGKPVVTKTEDTAHITNASQQLTLQKVMPLRSLQPGKYTVEIKVKDNIKNQTVNPTTAFELQ